jgi:hypothetical protein
MSGDAKRRRGPWALCAFLIALPVLYVLSMGPVVWICNARGEPELGVAICETLYAPIDHLATHSDLILEFLRWYLNLVR